MPLVLEEAAAQLCGLWILVRDAIDRGFDAFRGARATRRIEQLRRSQLAVRVSLPANSVQERAAGRADIGVHHHPAHDGCVQLPIQHR